MMEKKIEDYLHLYIGCKALLLDYDGNKPKEFLLNVYNLNYYRDWRSDIRPILRPLSSMTEEEMLECGNMEYDFSDDPELNIWGWRDFEIGLSPEQVRWLLSKHFDLFGLIDAGLATRATP